MLAAGWVRCRSSAAARTLPSKAICTNTSSWRGLMLIISQFYMENQIFKVLFMHADADNGGTSGVPHERPLHRRHPPPHPAQPRARSVAGRGDRPACPAAGALRSEEHTSELQSPLNLV